MISSSLLKHKFAGIFLEPAGCSRLNMDETSSDWIPAASMNHWHGRRWQMVSLGKKAYAMGGFRDYGNNAGCPVDIGLQVMERYDEDTNMWSDVAPYPINIHNHCMAPDEETGRIWVIGGRYISGTTGHDRGDLRYYEVECRIHQVSNLKSQASTNTWHGNWNMRWHRGHHACGIIKLAYNDEKRLYVFGGWHGGWRLKDF